MEKLIELYNEIFNPFKDYDFKLAEISFGHGAFDSRKNDQVFYFDYPYTSEFGHITDLINNSLRGILPEGAKIDRDTYKNLDIDMAHLFAKNRDKAYILYKYIPTDNGTPCIVDIKSNIGLEEDENIYDKLIRYFFIIYHCTQSTKNLDKRILFNNIPQVTSTKNADNNFKYLMFFNSLSEINSKTEKQAITTAFIGQNDKICEALTPEKGLINKVYEQLFPMLDIMFNNPVLTYLGKQNAANISRMEGIKNLNRTNHIVKTYLKTKIEPHIKNLNNKYPHEKSYDILVTNIKALQSVSEFFNLIDKLDNTNDKDLVTLLTNTGFYSTTEKLSINKLADCLYGTIQDNWNLYEDNPQIIIKNPEQLTAVPENFLSFKDCHVTINFMEIIILTVVENIIQYGKKTNREYHIELVYDKKENSLSFKNRTIQDAHIQVSGEQLRGNFRIFNDLLHKLGIGRIELFQERGTFEFTFKLINL